MKDLLTLTRSYWLDVAKGAMVEAFYTRRLEFNPNPILAMDKLLEEAELEYDLEGLELVALRDHLERILT